LTTWKNEYDIGLLLIMTNYYELKPFSTEFDLTNFYAETERRGYVNNLSQKVMVDCFKNEEKSQVWILFKNDKPIGSVAAHSFPEMGVNSFRIMARTCTIDTGSRPNNGKGLNTMSDLLTHQDISSQFYIPKCIEWCGIDSNMYITSNALKGGSQRRVHTLWLPMLAKQGEFTKIKEIHYRGTIQTVWKLNANTYLDHLAEHKWKGHVLL
jgi:hypothetical protein